MHEKFREVKFFQRSVSIEPRIASSFPVEVIRVPITCMWPAWSLRNKAVDIQLARFSIFLPLRAGSYSIQSACSTDTRRFWDLEFSNFNYKKVTNPASNPGPSAQKSFDLPPA